jgi:hypothetical protein
MDFALAARPAPGANARESTYSEELKAQVKEAWEIQQSQPGHDLLVEFKDQEERDAWLRKAQAYGKTQDLFVSRRRGAVTADNVLQFSIVRESARQQIIAERKERAAELAAKKAAESGAEVIVPGRSV